MQIFLKTLHSGQTITLDVDPSATIDDLEVLIQGKQGIPLCLQRLIYGGMQLENGHTLAEYNIGTQCLVYLVWSLRGC